MNKLIFITFALLAISFVVTSSIKSRRAVPLIEVYIESLCPNCKNFIGNSFQPFHNNPKVNHLAEVKFVSYGNAHYNWNGTMWDITCQHGPNECYGNVVFTCASHLIKTPKEFYDALICFELKVWQLGKDFDRTVKHCIADTHLASVILECANSRVGNFLEYKAAVATPPHQRVPWVVVNGVHDFGIEAKIKSSLTDYLCALPENKDEEGCRKITGKVEEFSLILLDEAEN